MQYTNSHREGGELNKREWERSWVENANFNFKERNVFFSFYPIESTFPLRKAHYK
jgi:hypothetical protein